MKGLIFAFVSMAALGVSNYFYKRSTQLMSPVNTTFFYYLFSVVIALVVWVLFREKEPVPRAALIWPALIAVFLFTSVLTFNYAVQTMNVSTGATVRGLSFLVTVLLAVVFSKESLSAKDYLGILLAVGAVVLFGFPQEEREPDKNTLQGSPQSGAP